MFGRLLLGVIAFLLFSQGALTVTVHLSFGYGRNGTYLSDLTGGQNYNTQAGSGLYLSGGVILPISPTIPHSFEAQLGIGYLYQGDSRDENNSVSWTRFPI